MKLWIAVLMISGLVAKAATNTAASSSYSDVNTAIGAAARGDTIIVPAGASSWGASTLTLTKGVSLIGAGRTSTLISSSGISISIEPDATALSNGEQFRVSGISFNGTATAVKLLQVIGAGATATKGFTNLAVGNCMFTNMANVTSGAGTISLTKQVRGVIYSNIFDCCNIILKSVGNDDTNEWSNGNWPRAFGSADNLYFEGNTIQYSRAYSGPDSGWTETGQGSRLVMRYNTWNMANATYSELWDQHGFQNWPGGQTGTMITECYGNTIAGFSSYRWVDYRGGWGLLFNNQVTSGTGGPIEINQYAAGDSGGSGCMVDIPTWVAGLYDGQITNTYFWNNTITGTDTATVAGSIGDGCGTAQNQNWYNYNAAFNGTVGIGRGTTAPGGTCTTGVGYWKAATATSTTDPVVVQAGTFYKATAANTWTAYYTPYTFPHPLSASAASGSITVTPSLTVGNIIFKGQ